MARIAVLLDNKFEDSEYKKPATAYKKAKHELVIIGVKKGIVTGEKAGLKVKVEKVRIFLILTTQRSQLLTSNFLNHLPLN